MGTKRIDDDDDEAKLWFLVPGWGFKLKNLLWEGPYGYFLEQQNVKNTIQLLNEFSIFNYWCRIASFICSSTTDKIIVLDVIKLCSVTVIIGVIDHAQAWLYSETSIKVAAPY